MALAGMACCRKSLSHVPGRSGPGRASETGCEGVWWSYGSNARVNNVGWRIDYWLVSGSVKPRLILARIWPDIHGSEHCPVELDLC